MAEKTCCVLISLECLLRIESAEAGNRNVGNGDPISRSFGGSQTRSIALPVVNPTMSKSSSGSASKQKGKNNNKSRPKASSKAANIVDPSQQNVNIYKVATYPFAELLVAMLKGKLAKDGELIVFSSWDPELVSQIFREFEWENLVSRIHIPQQPILAGSGQRIKRSLLSTLGRPLTSLHNTLIIDVDKHLWEDRLHGMIFEFCPIQVEGGRGGGLSSASATIASSPPTLLTLFHASLYSFIQAKERQKIKLQNAATTTSSSSTLEVNGTEGTNGLGDVSGLTSPTSPTSSSILSLEKQYAAYVDDDLLWTYPQNFERCFVEMQSHHFIPSASFHPLSGSSFLHPVVSSALISPGAEDALSIAEEMYLLPHLQPFGLLNVCSTVFAILQHRRASCSLSMTHTIQFVQSHLFYPFRFYLPQNLKNREKVALLIQEHGGILVAQNPTHVVDCPERATSSYFSSMISSAASSKTKKGKMESDEINVVNDAIDLTLEDDDEEEGDGEKTKELEKREQGNEEDDNNGDDDEERKMLSELLLKSQQQPPEAGAGTTRSPTAGTSFVHVSWLYQCISSLRLWPTEAFPIVYAPTINPLKDSPNLSLLTSVLPTTINGKITLPIFRRSVKFGILWLLCAIMAPPSLSLTSGYEKGGGGILGKLEPVLLFAETVGVRNVLAEAECLEPYLIYRYNNDATTAAKKSAAIEIENSAEDQADKTLETTTAVEQEGSTTTGGGSPSENVSGGVPCYFEYVDRQCKFIRYRPAMIHKVGGPASSLLMMNSEVTTTSTTLSSSAGGKLTEAEQQYWRWIGGSFKEGSAVIDQHYANLAEERAKKEAHKKMVSIECQTEEVSIGVVGSGSQQYDASSPRTTLQEPSISYLPPSSFTPVDGRKFQSICVQGPFSRVTGGAQTVLQKLCMRSREIFAREEDNGLLQSVNFDGEKNVSMGRIVLTWASEEDAAEAMEVIGRETKINGVTFQLCPNYAGGGASATAPAQKGTMKSKLQNNAAAVQDPFPKTQLQLREPRDLQEVERESRKVDRKRSTIPIGGSDSATPDNSDEGTGGSYKKKASSDEGKKGMATSTTSKPKGNENRIYPHIVSVTGEFRTIGGSTLLERQLIMKFPFLENRPKQILDDPEAKICFRTAGNKTLLIEFPRLTKNRAKKKAENKNNRFKHKKGSGYGRRKGSVSQSDSDSSDFQANANRGEVNEKIYHLGAKLVDEVKSFNLGGVEFAFSWHQPPRSGGPISESTAAEPDRKHTPPPVNPNSIRSGEKKKDTSSNTPPPTSFRQYKDNGPKEAAKGRRDKSYSASSSGSNSPPRGGRGREKSPPTTKGNNRFTSKRTANKSEKRASSLSSADEDWSTTTSGTSSGSEQRKSSSGSKKTSLHHHPSSKLSKKRGERGEKVRGGHHHHHHRQRSVSPLSKDKGTTRRRSKSPVLQLPVPVPPANPYANPPSENPYAINMNVPSVPHALVPSSTIQQHTTTPKKKSASALDPKGFQKLDEQSQHAIQQILSTRVRVSLAEVCENPDHYWQYAEGLERTAYIEDAHNIKWILETMGYKAS